jgi:hypothetical protein
MVRATGQFEAEQAARRMAISPPPGPAILNESEILERAAGRFRLRTHGDLEAVVSTAVTETPDPDSEI